MSAVVMSSRCWTGRRLCCCRVRRLADDGLSVAATCSNAAGEGYVAKDPEAHYVGGRSRRKWLKVKQLLHANRRSSVSTASFVGICQERE